MADQGQEDRFVAALTELGVSAGNRRMREALYWDDATCSDSRDSPNDVGSSRLLFPIIYGFESAGESAPHHP